MLSVGVIHAVDPMGYQPSRQDVVVVGGQNARLETMSGDLLSLPEAILLGVVEGITEFLPISSTGHLLVVSDLIGFGQGATSGAADTYAIAIQFGAILAVLALYRMRVWSMMQGVAGRDAQGLSVVKALVAAFVPAAVLGVVLGDRIKDTLFGPLPVAIAWAIGGLVLLIWVPRGGTTSLHELTVRSAFIIGIAQGVALWPGVSRSLVTLIAGLAIGLSLSAAIEFSFLLGLVTLTAATVFDTARNGGELVDMFGIATPLVGVFTAFVTALIAVRWMVNYLNSRSLAIFGWYRLGIASVAFVLMATGAL
jgi:undecaprenyl-diphosphatase